MKKKTSVEGIISGLGDLVEKLGALAEKGEEMKRSGLFETSAEQGNIRGVYGVSVKMGLGDKEEPRVETFGNMQRDDLTGKTRVHAIAEPLVDVIEEDDHLLVLAEMPGVADEDIRLHLEGDVLTLDAGKGSKKYHKEILLPRSFTSDQLTRSCNNGILELKFKN
jgi:HSP20 family protein